NIAGGDYVVQISGLSRLGRNAAGFTVVGRLKKGRGRVHIVVQTAATGAIVIGSILSILAILTLLAIVIYTAVRGRTTGGPTQRRVARSLHFSRKCRRLRRWIDRSVSAWPSKLTRFHGGDRRDIPHSC